MDGYRDDGRPYLHTFYGRTQKEVREKLKDFLEARAAGIDMSQKYTFAQWADTWFENHRDNITPTTQESYKYTLRILKDWFGRRKLMDIKPYDVENFLKQLRKEGRSDSALAQCRGMLFQILHKAEANDLVRKNAAFYADKMRSQNTAKEKEAFTADEVRLLMEKLPKDKMGLTIRLMLGTGMRTQEVMALEPRHIHEDGAVIEIRQATNMVKGTTVVGRPKSRDSYRDVPVPPNLRWCAIELRNTGNKYIWEVGKKDCPCNSSYFRKKYKETLRKVEGVRILNPHNCRHTYISQMQSLGISMETIKSMAGHSTVNMTRHYLHVQENIRKEAVEKFSEAFVKPMKMDE
jgi:integrase